MEEKRTEERTGDTYVKSKAKQQDTRQQDKIKQNKKIKNTKPQHGRFLLG
jgi:hypothetical protein